MLRTVAIVAPSPVPLRFGGAERHWEAMAAALRAGGLSVDIIKLPVRESRLDDLLVAYESFARVDLTHVDLVISGKYPAWMVQHPRHVVWMLHPLRGLYDTYNPAAFEDWAIPGNPAFSDLVGALEAGPAEVNPDELIALVRSADMSVGQGAFDPGGPLALPGPLARRLVHHLDRWALDPSRVEKHLAISAVVAERADYFPPGVNVQVLHPPPAPTIPIPHRSAAESAATDGRSRQLVSVCRLEPPKRVDLIVRAFAEVAETAATLEVIGEGSQKGELEALARGDGRVRFRGFLSDAEIGSVLAESVAAVVTPVDEDFGYVTVEAMREGTPVITTTDSGGPAEVLTDGVDGVVSDPSVPALAAAMTRLLNSPQESQALGRAARRVAETMSWSAAVEAITRLPRLPLSERRRKVVAVSTFPVSGAPGGGPARAEHLLRGLAEAGWEVVVVCLDVEGVAEPPASKAGFRQVAVPTSQRHARAEAQLRRLTGNVSVSDITASVLWRATPEFSRALARELYDASAAVCVQPFLAGAVLDTDNEIPMVLDAHNSEVELKSQLLARDEAGLWMLERVREIERFATQRSVLVAATTESDLRDLRALAAGNGAGDNPVAGTGSWVVVPNGVDVGEIKFVTGEERRQLGRSMLARLHAAKLKHLVLFVGSAHPPNITAGRWLASKAHLIPDSLVVLAGEHSDSVDVDRTPNVRALGTVDTDDLKRLLAAASVAVNPTIGGSGSNLKLIEYLAAGAPVVTTPDGARGIEYPHVVASLAPLESFMSTLREVLANPSSRRVTAARELAESRYDWAMTARRFAEQLESALEGDGSGSGVGGQQAGEAP